MNIKRFVKDIKAAAKRAFGFKVVCFSNGGREFVSYHWRYREALARAKGNSKICWAADVVCPFRGVVFSVTRQQEI